MSKSGADLSGLVQKKKLEDELKGIEKQIYELEGNYLEETQNYGNVIRGWDGYLKSSKQSNLKTKQHIFRDTDRLFSSSSTTSPLEEDPPSLDSGSPQISVSPSKGKKKARLDASP
mmetsp:Transcript_45894/g.74887  ORF Transcript_45894/g.74887 Transcript_45894/m.74887 type:complete len:116 (-) Transcript_45894:221-568(-)